VFVPEAATTGAQMQVGDLVKKQLVPARAGRTDLLIGVVVEVRPGQYLRGCPDSGAARKVSYCRVNFGDYGTFWQSSPQIELLS